MGEKTQGGISDIQAFIASVTADIPKDTGEKLKAERQALFDEIDRITTEVRNDPALLKTVLRKSADFPERSINNVLLIGKFRPEASLLKTFQDWKKLGVWVNAENSIQLMAKGNPYIDGNGKTRNSYSVRKYYDVSETNMKRQAPAAKRKASEFFQALGADPPCKFRFYDDMPRNALYVPETDTLYVKTAMKNQPESCFMEIVGELSQRNQYMQNKQGYNRESADTVFKAECTKFIVATRCGMDSGKIDLTKDMIPGVEPKDLKGMLSAVHKDAASLYQRIEKHLPEPQTEREKTAKKEPVKKPAKQEAPVL